MTRDQENIVIVRGLLFTIGAALLAVGFGLNSYGVVGAAMMAAAVPGMMSRKRAS